MSTVLSEPAPERVAPAVEVAAEPGASRERIARIVAPLAIGLVGLALWQLVVSINDIPHYILPGPILVLQTLIADWAPAAIVASWAARRAVQTASSGPSRVVPRAPTS